jgi:hypothetical protein
MEPPLPLVAMGGQMDDAAPLPIIPLVLQVSPLPGSADQEEFFYDPSPDVHHGPVAATREFFLAQGRGVIVLDCPDIGAFQAACPSGALFNSFAALPPQVFTEGYARLQELALATIAAAMAVVVANDAPNDAIWEGFATSLFKCYAKFPSVSLLGPLRATDFPVSPPSGPSRATSLPPGPPSFVGTSVGRPPVFGYAPVGLLPGVGNLRATGLPASPPPFGNAPIGLLPGVGISPSDLSRWPDPDTLLPCWPHLFKLISHIMGGTLPAHSITMVGTIRSHPLAMGGPLFHQLLVVMGGFLQIFKGAPLLGFSKGITIMGGFPILWIVSLKCIPWIVSLKWCTVVMSHLVKGFLMCRHRLGRTRVSRVRQLFRWPMRTYVCPWPWT